MTFAVRRSPLIATVMTVCFLATLFPARPARAGLVGASVSPAAAPAASSDALYAGSAASLGVSQGAEGAVADARVDTSSGALTAAIPIETPPARGAAQVGLTLQYSSNGGTGVVARGWSLSLPTIERHNLSGGPTFNDPKADGDLPGDRMTYGGSPLVPICVVGSASLGCASLLARKEDPKPEQFPASLNGYFYFRLEHEGGALLRFFWSPDRTRWVVQSPSGITEEYGAPSSAPTDTSAIDFSNARPFRWNLSRKYDAQRFSDGSPANVIVYQWAKHPSDTASDAAVAYLFDIYDTPPPAPGAALSDFAHHVHFTYGNRNGIDARTRVWRAGHRFAVSRIDITSARFSDRAREQFRRYRFLNTSPDNVYELTNLTIEGQCDATNTAPNPTESNGLLPDTGPICRKFPGYTFHYDSAALLPTVTNIGAPLQSGYIPTLLDINNDGLPDLISRNDGATTQSVAINPGPSSGAAWAQTTIGFAPTSAIQAFSYTFSPSNPSYVSGNWAGDGRTNVLWLDPQANASTATRAAGNNNVAYEIYSTAPLSGGWAWNFAFGGSGKTFPMTAYAPLNPSFQVDDRMPKPSDGGPPIYNGCGFYQTYEGKDTILYSFPNDNNRDYEFGGQSKYLSADIDGDGFSDLVTNRPIIHADCHFAQVYAAGGVQTRQPYCKFKSGKVTGGGTTTDEYAGYSCQEDVYLTNRYFTQLTTRASDGTIQPFHEAEAGFCVNGDNRTESVLGVTYDPHNPSVASMPHGPPDTHVLMDMNADGLPDWVQIATDHLSVALGHGDGNFGVCADGTLECGCGGAFETWPAIPGVPDMTKGQLHDVDADGHVDFILSHEDTGAIDVYRGTTNTSFSASLSIDFAKMAGWDPGALKNIPGTRPVQVLYADMDGNGTDDIVVESGNLVAYADLYDPLKPPRLLSQLDNNLGASTTVSYVSTAVLDGRLQWTSHTPQPAALVTKTATSNSLPTTDSSAFRYASSYIYQNPVYDGRDRSLIGFESVAVGRDAPAGSSPAFTKTTFFNAHCGGSTFPCAGSGSADYAASALRGLPVLTEVYSTTTDNPAQVPMPVDYLSTTHTMFDAIPLYHGLDGRIVRRVFAKQSDTWLYDTAPFISSPSTSSDLTDVVYDGGSFPASFAIRSSANHMRSSSVLDPFRGFVVDTIDYGQLDAHGAIFDDSTIEQTVTFDLAPGSDSGWLWRATGTTTTGRDAAGNAVGVPRSSFNAYDARGNLLSSSSLLYGTLPLRRSHAVAGTPFSATAPASASPTDTTRITFAQYAYALSGTGQVTRFTSATGRCTEFDYDPIYQHLPVSTRVPLDGCDPLLPVTTGTHQLVAQTPTWNRGLATATSSVAPSGARVTLALDGLGRVISTTEPDPTIPGNTTPSTSIDYGDDQAIPRKVHVTTASTDAWSYIDGLGRVILNVTRADATDDGYPYIVSGQVQYDAFGRPIRSYKPWFYDGSPLSVPLTAPSSAYSAITFDSFDRVLTTSALDGTTPTAAFAYHGLSTTYYDGSEIKGAPNADHVGGSRSITRDGHGRIVQRGAGGKDSQGHFLSMGSTWSYLPTGEVSRITRPGYVRTMQYDSWGRLVQNAEPNTSIGFDPAGQSSSMTAWRYAYDNDGHIVGTSDARGCGKNLWYDMAGRLTAEDYSPCAATQLPYSAPTLDSRGQPTSGDNTEAFYTYDATDGGAAPAPGITLLPSGRLNEVFDRAAHTAVHYDLRGRLVSTVRSLAKPGNPDPSLASRYTPHSFRNDTVYDLANRVTDQSSGADVPGVLALSGPEAGQSWVHLHYSPTRGTLRSIGSSYGDLVSNIKYDVDGLLLAEKLQDAGQTIAEYGYDSLYRRLQTVNIHRASVSPTVLERSTLVRDNAGRPKSLIDGRIPIEWSGAPATVASRTATYDDFGQLATVDTRYGTASGSDSWSNPNAGIAQAPPLPVTPANRVQHQEFHYNATGDLTYSDDNEHAFLDRSFGTSSLGAPTAGPNQLQSIAATVQLANEDSPKSATLLYDFAGNLSSIDDGRTSSFGFDWDEVGRLSGAARWDYVAHAPPKTGGHGGPICSDNCPPPPTTTYTIDWKHPAVYFRYAYDASGSRVLHHSVDYSSGHTLSTTAEVFGSLRLNHATWDSAANDYDRTTSETAYLFAGFSGRARVLNAQLDPTTGTSGRQHVLFELRDHLGSTSAILDKDTGELVEASTFLPYGGAESDYHPQRWASFREDYRFTGKEADTEVGLVYFGARYYAPALGRFISPDPLTIHAAAGDLNPYAYVRGSPFVLVDPTGLDPCDGDKQSCPPPPPPTADDPGCDAICMAGGWRGGDGGGNDGGGSGPPAAHFEGARAGQGGHGVPVAVQPIDGHPAPSPSVRQPAFFQRDYDGGEITEGMRDPGVVTVVGNTRIVYYGVVPPDPPLFVDHTDALVKSGHVAFNAVIMVVPGGRTVEAAVVTGEELLTIASDSTATKVVEATLPPLRQQYVNAINDLGEMAPSMRASGASPEVVARALSAERRAIGEAFKDLTPPELREQIYARNLAKYGDKLGPTVDWLRLNGKTWDQIIESSVRTGGKDLGF